MTETGSLMVLDKTFLLDVAGNVEDRGVPAVRLEHAKNALQVAVEEVQTENHETGDGR